MKPNYLVAAESWLSDEYDAQTRERVRYLIDNDRKELEESFYRHLEFGTGGLRGIMGVGTNRMNKYTVGMATQGVANYMKANFKNLDKIKVAISYDCRNNSREFAQITANVFAANGFRVYLFDSLRPTPELSYTIRHFGCQGGVMITASHNPKEYNGYKAYWEDGAQVTSPHDTNIIDQVLKITSPAQVLFSCENPDIVTIGEDVDKAYLKDIST
ncbi:MAG: phospho-sugar mutase, partial [Bacteroidetes bacterium]|nr:phospho-sugar mutase [Candidatus Egerieousia excrementavium]